MVDQISSLMPNEITLKGLTIDPIDEGLGHGNQKIKFKNHQLKVMGISPQVIAVNEWIARLKTRSWVKEVQLESYSYVSEQNTGQFSIKISY